jgi:hypothetical protein
MPQTFSRKDLIAAVHNGIETAYVAYDAGANDWLDRAPEYFVTSHIFLSIRKNPAFRELKKDGDRNVVEMESGIQKTLKAASAVSAGRKATHLKGTKRFDLVVFNKTKKKDTQDNSPRVAIEVKSPVYGYRSSHSKDVRRLMMALQVKSTTSSLKSGVLAMYVSVGVPKRGEASIRELLEKKLSDLKINFKDSKSASVSFHHGKLHIVKDEGAWAACCVLVERI